MAKMNDPVHEININATPKMQGKERKYYLPKDWKARKIQESSPWPKFPPPVITSRTGLPDSCYEVLKDWCRGSEEVEDDLELKRLEAERTFEKEVDTACHKIMTHYEKNLGLYEFSRSWFEPWDVIGRVNWNQYIYQRELEIKRLRVEAIERSEWFGKTISRLLLKNAANLGVEIDEDFTDWAYPQILEKVEKWVTLNMKVQRILFEFEYKEEIARMNRRVGKIGWKAYEENLLTTGMDSSPTRELWREEKEASNKARRPKWPPRRVRFAVPVAKELALPKSPSIIEISSDSSDSSPRLRPIALPDFMDLCDTDSDMHLSE